MKAVLWRRANREDAAGNAPISLRITIAKERAEIVSGIEVPEVYWNRDTHRLEQPAKKDLRRPLYTASKLDELNAQLLELEGSAHQAYKKLRQDYHDGRRDHQPSARDILEAVRGIGKPAKVPLTVPQSFARFMEAIEGPGINKSENTLKTYRSRLGNLLEFFAETNRGPKFLLRDVDLPIGRQLERWCLSQMDKIGQPRFGHAAMVKQVNMLQMVVAWAAIEGYVPVNTLHGYKYQSTATPVMPRALQAAEVELLKATVFSSPIINDVADMFVFCCYQALSFVDYCRFALDPVAFLHTDAQGREWIRMTRQKMKNRKPEGFSVPFFPEARAIFERRRGRMPVRSNKATNEYLKIIGAELGLSLTELTFKDSRSTFAQRWRDAGVSGAVVAAMMGDEERVVNKNYSRIRETAISTELSNLNLVPELFS